MGKAESMMGILLLVTLLALILILAVGLKHLIYRDHRQLDASFQLRIGLSLLLFVIIMLAFHVGLIEPSRYAQYI